MKNSDPFADVGRAVGLCIQCEMTHLEPRYTIDLEQDCLRIRIRNDQSIAVGVVDHDAQAPAVLIQVQEETVQREPVLDLWLPYSARHLHLAYRRDGAWVLAHLPASCDVTSVSEARQLLADREEPRP